MVNAGLPAQMPDRRPIRLTRTTARYGCPVRPPDTPRTTAQSASAAASRPQILPACPQQPERSAPEVLREFVNGLREGAGEDTAPFLHGRKAG
ncbi:hypothetical protein [Streptomyces sp. CoH27]|uniref:hypothetical protein n=1 Tax=Streptomyces sp. CoH27 TaxID=2875763 RepID=UPI0035A8CADD